MDKITTDQKVLDYQIHICACGLSKHKPFCDGSHKKTQGESQGKACCYKKNDMREEITESNALELIEEMPNEY